jgi:hypothetical protein
MTNEYRPISDIVGNLHGGKYQFNEYGNNVFNPYEDDNAWNPSYSISKEEEQEEDESQMPKWAIQMKPKDEICSNPPSNNILNISPTNKSAKVTISNQERTWEKFYAKIMYQSKTDSIFYTLNTTTTPSLIVHPTKGYLAPRGGASNACDARNQYSDSVTLEVICTTDVSTLSEYDSIWLVVGTEEEKWYYKLNILNSN